MSKRTGPEELRILIVDDSETARRVAGTILRTRNWTICGEAENGRTSPDVLLLDLSMPDMISIEAAQQMTTANPSVPLILFTIVMTKEIGIAGREAGIRTIVPKSDTWSLEADITHRQRSIGASHY